MKTFIMVLFIVLSLPLWSANTCISCHSQLGDELAVPYQLWKDSVHAQVDVACQYCHGGDPTQEDPDEAMNPAKGFAGKPTPAESVKICGGCHSDSNFIKRYNPNLPTDQWQQYKTSQHGKLLAEGNQEVAVCFSCHGAHDIRRASDPTSPVYATRVVDTCAKCHAQKEKMQRYGLKGTEVEEYKQSVHAKMLYDKGDLSAPTCNDCHGNHGAMPPGVQSIGFVCGECHVVQRDYFIKSPHFEAWNEMGLAQCETCHGNHRITSPSDEMLDPQKGVCLECHSEGEKGFIAMDTMHQNIIKLAGRIQAAEDKVQTAERKGMLMEDGFLKLQESHNDLIKARAAVHSFNADLVNKIIQPALKKVEEADNLAKEAFKELAFRRKGLLIFLIIAIILSFLIWLKIREMEKEP